MGACCSASNVAPSSSQRSKRYTCEQKKLVATHLPAFPFAEPSTTEHLSTVKAHANALWSTFLAAESADDVAKRARVARVFTKQLEHQSEFRVVSVAASEELANIFNSMAVLVQSPQSSVATLNATLLRFGVRPLHWNAIGIALIQTLQELSSEHGCWGSERENAWRRVFAHSVVLLLSSAASRRPVAPQPLPEEHTLVVRRYLSTFHHPFKSTDAERQLAASHWNTLFQVPANASLGASAHSTSHSQTEKQMQVALRVAQLHDGFYEFLQENAPELQFVFKTSTQVRSRIMLHLNDVVRMLLQADSFAESVSKIARTHIISGVQLEQYDILGRALLHALKECSGAAWSPEMDAAWRHLYCHCAAVLLVEHQKMTTRVQKGKSSRTSTGTFTSGSAPMTMLGRP